MCGPAFMLGNDVLDALVVDRVCVLLIGVTPRVYVVVSPGHEALTCG